MKGLEAVFADSQAETVAAFECPQAGQRFTEMYAFWVYVVRVAEDGRIWTLEGNPPITFPDEAELREYATADEYRARFAYGSIPGYWVRFVDDSQNVEGWYDLLPTERPGPHIEADVRDVDLTGYDLMIAHPPCTHLAVSGARYFAQKQHEQAEALDFVRWLLDAPVPRIALENPVSVISSRVRKPDQIIHPWQFGHAESKTTCLWLKNLWPLVPTAIIDPEYACPCGGPRFEYALGKHGCANCGGSRGPAKAVYANQTPSGQNKLGPSPTRAADRAKTYEGIAVAMAEQWGAL